MCPSSLQAAEQAAPTVRELSHTGKTVELQSSHFYDPFHVSFNVLPCYRKPHCVCLHGVLLGSSSVRRRDPGLPECLDCALDGLGAGAQDAMEGAAWGTKVPQLPSLL